MSVNILIPQSEEDSNAPGGRTEWLPKKFNMSSISHICIGCIYSTSSILNVYLMFSWMIHWHPVNGRAITLILQDVIDIFDDMVLLPSISHSSNTSWDPYLKQTLGEARYKNRGAACCLGKWGAPKTIPLSNDDFIQVQKQVQEIITDGLEQLSMYGLCFFVLKRNEYNSLQRMTREDNIAGQKKHWFETSQTLIGTICRIGHVGRCWLMWAYHLDHIHQLFLWLVFGD